MASWEPDEINFEDQYNKADTIGNADLDTSMTLLNESIREQEELEKRIRRAEWTSTNKDERTILEQKIAFNEKKQGLYIMRASKTILSILHRGFDKIKQDGRVMVLDGKSAEKLYSRLHLVESDEGTYKVAFENESGTSYKDILSPGNRWLAPNAYSRTFCKKFMKDIGFDVDKPKSGTKTKIPKKRIEQIERYIGETDVNAKQFARELNELPTNEDNRDNIILQDIITKNEIATDLKVKLIEASLTEIGVEASTQTGGLTLRELEGLDKELRTISGSLRSAIAKSIAKQVDIDKENRKLEEMANDETYSDEQREEVRARLQRFQDERKAINDQICILKRQYSNQIYQIRESIMKFLDKETGTLGERIRTLFKEQGITIVSILTALGMTLGVLIEALLGGPSTSTPTSGGTSGGDKKGGDREWIKNKLKALSQLLGKLSDKALASLPGIIGSIISWILNRAKEVVGWLSKNLWALIKGVGVLKNTYFMTKTRRDESFEHPPYCKDSCSSQYQSNLFFLIGDLIRIRFLNIMFELDVRFDILFVFFIGLNVRFHFLLDIWFSFHLWLDIRFSFYHFYLFGLVIEIDL